MTLIRRDGANYEQLYDYKKMQIKNFAEVLVWSEGKIDDEELKRQVKYLLAYNNRHPTIKEKKHDNGPSIDTYEYNDLIDLAPYYKNQSDLENYRSFSYYKNLDHARLRKIKYFNYFIFGYLCPFSLAAGVVVPMIALLLPYQPILYLTLAFFTLAIVLGYALNVNYCGNETAIYSDEEMREMLTNQSTNKCLISNDERITSNSPVTGDCNYVQTKT